MKWKIGNRQTSLYLMSLVVLLVGLGSAVWIYQSAKDGASGASAYEIIGGRVYPGSGNNKKYVHDLQLYGGQAAVLADEFTRWLGGLWQGTQLAYTVGCITVLVSMGFFIAARKSPPA